MKAYNWSLHEIDETSIESLLPFVGRIAGQGSAQSGPKRTYCDDVDWL